MTELHESLMALAIDIDTAAQCADGAVKLALQGLAMRASELANEAEHYFPATAEGDCPTNAQAIALARFLRPAFRPESNARDAHATVARGGFDLPEGYIHVRLADGYEGGIAPDGRTST